MHSSSTVAVGLFYKTEYMHFRVLDEAPLQRVDVSSTVAAAAPAASAAPTRLSRRAAWTWRTPRFACRCWERGAARPR